MSSAIEIVSRNQLSDLGDGEYTATVGARSDITRNGRAMTDAKVDPSQPGDVLSVQPDGSFQTRPAGTAGPFERAVIQGTGLVYRPLGAEGRAFFLGLALSWPNRG